MTTKRNYEKPSMQVFGLKQQPQLLAGSVTVGATMDGTLTEEDIYLMPPQRSEY